MKDKIEVVFHGIKITLEKIPEEQQLGEEKKQIKKPEVTEIKPVRKIEKAKSVTQVIQKDVRDKKENFKRRPIIKKEKTINEELKFADFCDGKTAREIRDKSLDDEEITHMKDLMSELYTGGLLERLVKKGLLTFRDGRYQRTH